MDTTKKLKILEGVFGGPVKAAAAAGVTYSTWWNWTQGRPMSGASERVVDLLLELHSQQEDDDAITDPGCDEIRTILE